MQRRTHEPTPNTEHEVAHALIDGLPQCVLLLDDQAHVTGLNDAAALLLGYPHASVLGKALVELLPSMTRERLAHAAAEGCHAPAQEAALETLRTRDGPRTVRLTVAKVPLRACPLVITLADARLQEASPSESSCDVPSLRQRPELPLRLTWTCLPDGSCDFLSACWAEFTGVREEQLLGFAWLRHVHPEDTERLVSSSHRAMEAGTPYGVDFRLRRHDGAYRWFEARAAPVRDASGRITKWAGVNTEVHESRELRERLRIEQERLASVTENSPSVVVSYERDATGRAHYSYVSEGSTASTATRRRRFSPTSSCCSEVCIQTMWRVSWKRCTPRSKSASG